MPLYGFNQKIRLSIVENFTDEIALFLDGIFARQLGFATKIMPFVFRLKLTFR